MAIKQSLYKIQAMQRDNSLSAFDPKFSYENRNIRILAREDNTSFSLVNEKGNKKINIYNENKEEISLLGNPIGYSILNEYLVLFSTDENFDYIYRIERKDKELIAKTLYKGSLNFKKDKPIETLSVFENKDIQKVYWLDGINQPRVINIVATDSNISTWNNDSFNFVQELKLKETIKVRKDLVSSGAFTSGVVQYSFSYYNLYRQESNIFYSTPLNYISYNDRGGSPEEQIGNKFNITIQNPDTNFDYIRIYVTHRTSLDSTVTTRRLIDIPIDKNLSKQTLYYTDNGTQGEFIDNTLLLYIGGEDIVPKTMTQKDNTLFLGNLHLKRPVLGDIDINGRKLRDLLNNYDLNKFEYFTRGRQDYINITTDQSTKGTYPYDIGLDVNSTDIKHFKYLETYRLGIQAQYKTGKWSEPIWLNDLKITQKPYTNPSNQIAQLPVPYISLKDKNIIEGIYKAGYKRIRTVMVQSSIGDRDCLAQGIVSPTLFNVKDRENNAPFSQSSWFFRANPPFEVGDTVNTTNTKDIMNNDANVYDGAWPEFRHHRPIPDNMNRNCEIQLLSDRYLKAPYYQKDSDYFTNKEFVSRFGENYFIDQSLVTFHSPDIEFNESLQNSLDTAQLKFRIVGKIFLTGTAQDIDITTSTTSLNPKDPGFYKLPIGTRTYNENGFKQLIAAPLYWDATKFGDYTDKEVTGFYVFPWHANRSLNDDGVEHGIEADKVTSRLDKKKMSNLKYSAYTEYFDLQNIWEAGSSDSKDTNHQGITPISIFNSNEVITTKVQRPLGSSLSEFNYYGNYDKILSLSRVRIPSEDINNGDGRFNKKVNKYKGYTIITTDERKTEEVPFTTMYEGKIGTMMNQTSNDVNYKSDPVRIKYNSTPHAVFSFNYYSHSNGGSTQIILPSINNLNRADNVENSLFWDNAPISLYQDNIDTSTELTWLDYDNPLGQNTENGNWLYPSYKGNFGTMWLGELYREIPDSERYGGKNQEAFENNIWIPCNIPVSLEDNDVLKESINLIWEEGDTYNQRYDCLKTYPSSIEDQNSIVEILSFLCETRINIDGRYDRNRGNSSNLVANPTNFNLMNIVYSQSNNFFNYRSLNYDKSSLNSFPNSITWTKEKIIGEDIDTWTNITIASTVDLDGDKGEVVALKNFNNDIISFQEKGISQILYNSRIQIASSDTPIEISNNYKVDGKRYISNKLGTRNKWSIVDTSWGLYFMDELSKSIYLYGAGGIENISDNLGFHSWSNSNIFNKEGWDPYNFDNFVSSYDSRHKDIYFTNKKESLNYSEMNRQFISFFDYGSTPFMFNFGDTFMAIKYIDNNLTLWEQNEGRYNEFFGEFKPYSTTIVVNQDVLYDKTFTNLEFRADRWDAEGKLLNKTFDTLEVWNEYQKGIGNLDNISVNPLSLKRKFRVWRAFIPRDKNNPLNRIRNTWMYLKLSSNKEDYNKNILHDLVVDYII